MTVTIFSAMTPKGPTSFKMTEVYRKAMCPHWTPIEGTAEVTTWEALKGRCSQVLFDCPTLWPTAVRVSHQEEWPIPTWAAIFKGFNFAESGSVALAVAWKLLEHALNPFTGGVNLQHHPRWKPRLDIWMHKGTFRLVLGRLELEVFKKEKLSSELPELPVVEPKDGIARDFMDDALQYLREVMYYVGPSANSGDGFSFDSPNFGRVTVPAGAMVPEYTRGHDAEDSAEPVQHGELQAA